MIDRSENIGKILPHNIAMQLLTTGDVHVGILPHDEKPAKQIEETWSRQKVEDFILRHGAHLAGPGARSANHGIFCVDDDKTWYFFETKHH